MDRRAVPSPRAQPSGLAFGGQRQNHPRSVRKGAVRKGGLVNPGRARLCGLGALASRRRVCEKRERAKQAGETPALPGGSAERRPTPVSRFTSQLSASVSSHAVQDFFVEVHVVGSLTGPRIVREHSAPTKAGQEFRFGLERQRLAQGIG